MPDMLCGESIPQECSKIKDEDKNENFNMSYINNNRFIKAILHFRIFLSSRLSR